MQPRTALVRRKTKETDITLSLNLDGSGRGEVNTQIGFLDHMLNQLATHGLFDLSITATGDLHIDHHHTMEDVALVLGCAFNQALSTHIGLTRMGSALIPMDESLAQVVIDFSGRPFSVIDVSWNSPVLGQIPTTLFEHFFQSFSVTALCTLHARILYGKDDHHKAEALFKAFARALDIATSLDSRRVDLPSSTKGDVTHG